ncbi:aspartyl/asparaginyl beta-hydroxylase-like isoform X7 [Palaemon carinicauda]|uniref:aspartyl/asparaginyl beta-hydroxylase-like isoform X7 n=1 Tax=Palaemon carinicauda TaxID=392227 RepID=UPI0035B65DBC
MSGDLQTRKRRGKAKKKDEAEDDIFDAKTKPMVNNSHKVSNGGAGGGGGSSNGSSGLVAKIIFLILLVSLSIVIGLILIELRGKQAGMEMASVVPKAEEQAAPEIPTPSLHVEEPGPEAPSVSEPEIEDEFEPFEATPPLEEYVSVVEKEEEPVEEEVVEVVEDIPVEVVEEIVEEAAALPLEGIEIHEESEEPIPAESEEEAIPVEEEAEELAPVEEVVEAAVSEEVESPAAVEEVEEEATPEEVEEPAAAEEEEELEEPTVDLDVEELAAAEEVVQAVVEEPAVIEEVVEVPAIVEEVEEPAAVEELEEPAVVEEVEEPAVVEEVEEPAVVEEVEELAVVEEVEEPAVVEEVEEPAVVEEVEEPAVVEVEEPAVVEEVEEPAVVEVEESAPVVEAEEEVEVAPVEAVPVPPVEEEPVQVVEEPVIVEKVEEVEAPIEVEEKEDDDDDDDDDEEEEEEDPEDDEDKDDDEVDEPKIVLPPPEEEDDEDWSQYGKDGGIEDLTQAYLRVESLAEEVLRLDPENSMVNHIAPHLSGVLRAMEEGRTEGILDTLNHIQVILEDVKKRMEDGDGAPIDGTADAKSMYGKADITSDVDYDIREELDAAEKLISENLREALTTFGALLQNNPKSARALYGRAMCLDRLAEEERSNSKLEQAILTYRGVIDLADEEPSLVPLPLLRFAAEKCIDRMRFRGFFGKAVRVQQRLLQRFPDDLALRNQMGVTYLLMHQPSAAKEVFEAILEKWPEDGFAQVHYGFILKTNYQNYTGGAIYMKKGIESKAEGTQDGRFFLHLGDALQREGQVEEAYEVYEEAVEKGLFLNRYQRSLYNVDRLKSQPTWTVEQTTYTEFFRKLEANWQAIRDEAVALLAEPPQDGFRPESENLRSKGDWKQYEMYSRGRKITANCVKAKVTCSLIDEFTPAAGCKRGQVKFSVMDPGTHVYAHTGPTNCRLRAHLGLVIPSGVQMRVADQMVNWEEGKIFIFDDSWEHEVWHNGTTKRLVLIVDVWHPELTDHEKKSLSPL